MESLNGGQTQSSFTVVSDVYRNENDNNCFLREDCLIDFNNLVNGLNIDKMRREIKEGIPISRDTSETESATEEVEEVDIKLIGDDVIIFQTEDDMKEAYPNLQVYNETQNIQQTFTVANELNHDMKNDFNYSSIQYQEENSFQGPSNTDFLESGINSESTVINFQDHSESTLEPTYYYIDSFPLTKNPPDITADDSHYDETNLEGSYTVGGNSSTQSALSSEIVQICKEEPNEIEHYATEENDNNIVIISMKKFFVDHAKGPAKQPSKPLLTSSLPTHKWKRLYECYQCGKKFSHSINLQIHMEVHTHELHPHKCSQCGVSFAKSRQLLRHLKKHTSPKKKNLDCPICEATYKTHGHLRHHLIVVHGVENVSPAFNQISAPKSSSAQILIVKPTKAIDTTTFNLNSSGTGTEHEITNCKSQESPEENNEKNVVEDLFKCPICNKAYKSRGSFKKHVSLHNEEEYPFEYQRAVCDNKFLFGSENKEYDMIHAREELISSEFSFKCSVCDSHFSNFVTMIKHKNTQHRPFRCRKKFCKAKFSHRHLLDRHLIESHSKSHFKKHFTCRTCGSSFMCKSNLNLRSHVHFPLGKPYRCARCFSGMIAKSNLERLQWNPRVLEYLEKNETGRKPITDEINTVKQEEGSIQYQTNTLLQ